MCPFVLVRFHCLSAWKEGKGKEEGRGRENPGEERLGEKRRGERMAWEVGGIIENLSVL